MPTNVRGRLKFFIAEASVSQEVNFPGPSKSFTLQLDKSVLSIGGQTQISEPNTIGSYKWNLEMKKAG